MPQRPCSGSVPPAVKLDVQLGEVDLRQWHEFALADKGLPLVWWEALEEVGVDGTPGDDVTLYGLLIVIAGQRQLGFLHRQLLYQLAVRLEVALMTSLRKGIRAWPGGGQARQHHGCVAGQKALPRAPQISLIMHGSQSLHPKCHFRQRQSKSQWAKSHELCFGFA